MHRFLVIVIIVGAVFARDITLYKDSLWIFNGVSSTNRADSLIIKNSGPQAVLLDSARLDIASLDTSGSLFHIANAELLVLEQHGSTKSNDFFTVKKDATGHYLDFSATSKPLLSMGPSADSVVISNVQIVNCFSCNMPLYPTWFRGSIRFFFSNGETADIRLYSDDLRKPGGEACHDYACDSQNVRKILDRNGMQSVPVGEVSSIANGRIASLQLSYNPAGVVTLPKPITILPDEIGNLTALGAIMAGGNTINSISQRIGRCNNLTSILADNNGIAGLPDSIARCSRLKHLSLENNRLTQLPESFGKLKSLEKLTLTKNHLVSLPESMVELDSLNCLFITNNRLCILSEALQSWMATVKARTICEKFEPAWPNSQDCSAAAHIPLCQRLPGSAVRLVSHEGTIVTMELPRSGITVLHVEIFTISGRCIETVNLSTGLHTGNTVRLDVAGYPTGVYYMKMVTLTSNAIVVPFIIDR